MQFTAKKGKLKGIFNQVSISVPNLLMSNHNKTKYVLASNHMQFSRGRIEPRVFDRDFTSWS